MVHTSSGFIWVFRNNLDHVEEQLETATTFTIIAMTLAVDRALDQWAKRKSGQYVFKALASHPSTSLYSLSIQNLSNT